MAEGTKCLNASGMSTWFKSKTDKYEEAVDFFCQAGNAYKVAKAWREAGAAFEMAADCYAKVGSHGDCAGKFKEVLTLN